MKSPSYSIVALLLLVVCSLQQAAAFTSSSSSTVVVVRTTATPLAPQYRPTRVHPAFTATAFSSTTTALQLKVKVDPDKAGNKNEKGNNAMAAYGGSIAIAALLPVAFIIWSLVK